MDGGHTGGGLYAAVERAGFDLGTTTDPLREEIRARGLTSRRFTGIGRGADGSAVHCYGALVWGVGVPAVAGLSDDSEHDAVVRAPGGFLVGRRG